MDRINDLLRDGQWKEELSSPWVQWGGLLCIIIVFCFFVLEPYIQWRESEWSSLQQKALQLSKLSRISENGLLIQSATKKTEKQYRIAQKALLDAKTQSRAIGQQVGLFEDIFRPHGLKFAGRRFGEPSIEPWLGERIDSQWRLSGSSDDILSFLYDLASASYLMEATRIEIKPGNNSRKNKEPGYEIALELRSYRKLPIQDLRVGSR